MSEVAWETIRGRFEDLSPEQAERRLGELPDLSEDRRAALWLYSWSTHRRRRRQAPAPPPAPALSQGSGATAGPG